MPTKKYCTWRNASLFGNFDDWFRGKQGATSAPERTVGGDVDAFGLAVIENLLLGKKRVVFDLIDRGNHRGVG